MNTHEVNAEDPVNCQGGKAKNYVPVPSPQKTLADSYVVVKDSQPRSDHSSYPVKLICCNCPPADLYRFLSFDFAPSKVISSVGYIEYVSHVASSLSFKMYLSLKLYFKTRVILFLL